MALAKNSLRWFFREFVVIVPSLDLDSVLTSLCRIAGSATIAVVLYIELHGAAFGRDIVSWLSYGGLSVVLAVLIGNVVKEFCFGFCDQFANWRGREFQRDGVLLNGTPYREIQRPDGTWIRYESGAHRTVREWRDKYGVCHRVSSTTPKMHTSTSARRTPRHADQQE